MGVSWTKEQEKVINLRNRNILVSAAAGSGKTAVLVERIIKRITEGSSPIDIDSLLIVTFTNAAAAEMRERISMAIEKRLEEEPDNEHLIRQSTLVHHAMITTIHSFCLDVIRNHFSVIDLDPNFRIGDEGEFKLLKADTLEKLLEDSYEKGEESFYQFVECYSSGKTDIEIEKLILQLYEFSMSDPWPTDWLLRCREQYEATTMSQLEKKDWMKCAEQTVTLTLEDILTQVETTLSLALSPDGPYMYEEALLSDQRLIQEIVEEKAYDKRFVLFQNLTFARLSSKKDETVSEQKKEAVKEIRDRIKKSLAGIRDLYYYQPAEYLLANLSKSKAAVQTLTDLTIAFRERYREAKREKNLLDFHDLEHYALEILVTGNASAAVPSETALLLSRHYEEILIDEYQDSNFVQEMILTSISRERQGQNNVFMVGDVKQSIYKFRMARPELFMEKQETYTLEHSDRQRIDLHKNFRSRPQVLDSVNYLFEQIMAKNLGNIEYNEECALYPGASFLEGAKESNFQTEVLLIDGKEVDEKDGSTLTKRELEAKVIAKRIKELVKKENNYQVLDKQTGEYRTPRYSDIVILLRTISGWAEEFSTIFMAEGIPAHTGSQTGYFSTLEIQTLLNFLSIIDNPLQDIPFAAVLKSAIGAVTSEELAYIKSTFMEANMYEATKQFAESGKEESCREKCKTFLSLFEEFRKKASYTPIHNLIWDILERSGYGNYIAAMPGGEQRTANMDMLVEKAIAFEATSYRGLFHFIRYIKNLQKYEVDFGEAEMVNESDNTVRIMSIHKSKGLEFPICFVSGMGKPFNNQDARSKILLHPDLGVGVDYINPESRVRTQTLIKNVMKQQLVLENLGEELRVLYVGLTRAKEKLLLTGEVKNLEKKLASWSQALHRKNKKLSYQERISAQNYYDWILKALVRHESFAYLLGEGKAEDEKPEASILEDSNLEGAKPNNAKTVDRKTNLGNTDPFKNADFSIQILSLEDLVEEEMKEQLTVQYTKEALENGLQDIKPDQETMQMLADNMSFHYAYEAESKIHTKMSISELKRVEQIKVEEESLSFYPKVEEEADIPRFIKNQCEEASSTSEAKEGEAGVKATGAARGTAYHKILQLLDFTRCESKEEVELQIEDLVKDGRITEEMKRLVFLPAIVTFLDTILAKQMVAAAKRKMLYRERQFVMGIPACEISEQYQSSEPILIQGIIDAFFEEEGELILLDYKTDRVESAEELKKRYGIQLDYYARALEQMTGKKVRGKYMYSFALRQVISA